MPNVYALEGLVPVLHPSTFVHPTAVLIGDVIIGPGCYIGPGASLRGDFGRIVVGGGANIQDNCVLHTDPEVDMIVGPDGHIGHSAVLHCCTIGRNALVGMGAVVMDRAEIGEEAIVAAMTFIKAGFKVPPRMLVAGVPGRIVREASQADILRKSQGTREYQLLAERCLTSLTPCPPLAEEEPNRRRMPLFSHKQKKT
jgi:phenylacetic acid degradation protein